MDNLFTNTGAKDWSYTYDTDITLAQQFHKRLPGYEQSPLVPLPSLAAKLKVAAVFVKDESNRFGLPAYKILGASWGTFRAIAAKTNLPLTATLEELSEAAVQNGISLYAATEGNHGRAIARMAKLLRIPAYVFLGNVPDEQVLDNIRGEGAEVSVVEGNFDAAVAQANKQAQGHDGGILVQDYAFGDYEEIPAWILEGYSTLLQEVEHQLAGQGLKATVMVVPIGAGSIGHAAVAHCKSDGRKINVLTVEPETAACLNHDLRIGKYETIETSKTIMDGMNCGTVNPISWPVLKNGVDASITISDLECHHAIQQLQSLGVNAGPCGGGTFAGFQKVAAHNPEAVGLDEDSVVVVLSTEGKRYYKIPE